MNPLLEVSPDATDCGALVGRHPDAPSPADYAAAGLDLSVTAMRAVRAKCLDCCSGQPGEVRKCAATDCPLWPLRVGRYPAARRATSSAAEQACDFDAGEGGGDDAL